MAKDFPNRIGETLRMTHIRLRRAKIMLRASLIAGVVGVTLNGVHDGTAMALAPVSSSYFTALPESGASEMQTPRNGAVAAALPDGRVLIAGGENGTTVKTEPIPFQSAELFDPATDTFTALPESGETEMHVARWDAVAVSLPSGQVLIAGGNDGTGPLKSAELFDPATSTFTLLPESGETEMQIAREWAVAAPLPDGDVLIASAETEKTEHSAELFHPATDTFTLLSESGQTATHIGRIGAVAASLLNGQILIAGGRLPAQHYNVGISAEVFNPATDVFVGLTENYPGGTEMRVDRFRAVAVRLPSGRVLITGGEKNGGIQALSAELFNPSTDTFTSLPASGETQLHSERTAAVAALLPSGQVLIAGGRIHESGGRALGGAELYTSAPEATVAGGEFGDQTVNEPSADQVLVVTNTGVQALVIAGASVSSGLAGDFAIAADGCAGGRLALWQTCTITTRFTPSFAGNDFAALTLEDNEPNPPAITLSGTGVAPNSGPTGPQGPSGPQGPPGPQGVTGEPGATGAQGTTGSLGATGAQGPAGPSGPTGQIELVTCKAVARGAGKRKKTVEECTAKLTSSPVTLTSTGVRITAAVSRGKMVYATGSAVRTGNKYQLLLTPRRHIGKGRYTLTLAHRGKHRREMLVIE